jgi:hypothetical protein
MKLRNGRGLAMESQRRASLSPQRGEGMRVRGGKVARRWNLSGTFIIPIPHPVEGRGRKSSVLKDSTRLDAATFLTSS